MNKEKTMHVEALRRTKIETTYEYVPIFGEIIGFWRSINRQKAGEEIHLVVDTPIGKWDRIIINGKEINKYDPI